MAKQPTSHLMGLIEDWRDSMAFPPSYRKMAESMGLSPSVFKSWREPKEMPERRTMLKISRLTGIPYRRVVDAAIEDAKFYVEPDENSSTRSDAG